MSITRVLSFRSAVREARPSSWRGKPRRFRRTRRLPSSPHLSSKTRTGPPDARRTPLRLHRWDLYPITNGLRYHVQTRAEPEVCPPPASIHHRRLREPLRLPSSSSPGEEGRVWCDAPPEALVPCKPKAFRGERVFCFEGRVRDGLGGVVRILQDRPVRTRLPSHNGNFRTANATNAFCGRNESHQSSRARNSSAREPSSMVRAPTTST